LWILTWQFFQVVDISLAVLSELVFDDGDEGVDVNSGK
jgi:hypothetical protein